jgi:hypothetical protein
MLDMNIYKIFLATTLSVLFMLLSSCGGGGGGDDGITNNGDDNNIVSDGVNGSLSGYLFMGASGDGKLLNLSTGEYSEIPGVDWSESTDNEYHPAANYYALPSRDGDEFIVTISHCLAGDDPLSPYDDCILIHNSDGSAISSGKLVEDIFPSTRLSNNKEYFAFLYNDTRDSSTNDELVIFDRNFQFIERSELPGRNARSFDWLNNGQIVYIHDQTIYITAPYSTSGTPIYSFSEEDGYPDYIAASPDGSKIAFTLVTYASYRTINGTTWIMNIDGTDLHQLAYVANNDNPIVNYPTWSPDGQYIMNMVGYVSGGGYIDLGVLGGLYAIPSSSRNIKINDNGSDGVVHVRSYFSSNQLNHDFSSQGNMVWIP